MKLKEIQSILNQNMVKEGEKITFDYESIAGEINNWANNLIQSKQPDLDAVKKESVAEFLQTKGFKSVKELDEKFSQFQQVESKYNELFNEKKQSILDTSIKAVLEEQKIDLANTKLVSKLLPEQNIFAEDGATINTDILKTNITQLFDKGGELEHLKAVQPAQPRKAGVEIQSGTSAIPPRKISKF